MASSETTHVLEIESGIGEPAFIPLSVGQELSPISVGRKGMWRIESARVLDVHAFVYFDGTALFLQTADEQQPAFVDGEPCPKAWTELAPPCVIEIGGARLRFRSLLPETEADAEDHTHAMEAPPQKQQTLNMPASALGLQPASPSAARGIPAKPDRPFAPGEFASRSDDATRVAPVEKAPRRGGEDGSRAVRPAAGVPATGTGGFAATPASGAMRPVIQGGPGPMGPMQGMSHPGVPVPMTPASMPPMSAPMQAQMGMQGAMSAPMQAMPGAYGSGPYAVPPNGYPAPPPSGALPPNAYHAGNVGPQGGQQQQPVTANVKKDDLATKWREMPTLRRMLILMSPLVLASAYYTIVVDEPAPPVKKTKPTASSGVAVAADAGPPTTTTALIGRPPATAPTMTAPAVGTSRPLGAVDGGALVADAPPALPTAVGTSTFRRVDPAPPATTTRLIGRDAGVAGPLLVDGKRTLERVAVDAYLAGDYPTAAKSYEALAEQTPPPSNIVYLEAARIIRTKMEARQR